MILIRYVCRDRTFYFVENHNTVIHYAWPNLLTINEHICFRLFVSSSLHPRAATPQFFPPKQFNFHLVLHNQFWWQNYNLQLSAGCYDLPLPCRVTHFQKNAFLPQVLSEPFTFIHTYDQIPGNKRQWRQFHRLTTISATHVYVTKFRKMLTSLAASICRSFYFVSTQLMSFSYVVFESSECFFFFTFFWAFVSIDVAEVARKCTMNWFHDDLTTHQSSAAQLFWGNNRNRVDSFVGIMQIRKTGISSCFVFWDKVAMSNHENVTFH